MRKIISLFQRNYETDRLVRDEIVPGAEWVVAGEGVPTRKYDGVCTLVRPDGDGVVRLYKRYELKPGKTAPAGWEACEEPDPVTGKQQGWVAVGDGPEDKYLREAFEQFRYSMTDHPDYGKTLSCEFLGPKSQGNVEGTPHHMLLPHAYAEPLEGLGPFVGGARTFFEGVRDFLKFVRPDIEGIVWHHPDGRMVKIKAKDFGLKRKPREAAHA